MHRYIITGVIFWLVSSFLVAEVQHHRPTAIELKALPPYCAIKYNYGVDRNNPQVMRWMEVLGPAYMHIHHYCTGLTALNRARMAIKDDADKDLNLVRTQNNFDYFTQRMQPDLVIKPEVHLKYGNYYELVKNYPLALEQYQTAINSKQNYSPAYAALSDLYKKMGKKQDALKTVKAGLAQSPKSKMLKRRLKKLERKS